MTRLPIRTITLSTALFLSLPFSHAFAQTAMQPPGKARVTPHTQQSGGSSIQRPVTDDMVQDAEENAAGLYPTMLRTGVGGQIQKAWNTSEDRDGVHKFRLCSDCIYKIRTREYMSTTVLLPTDAVIIDADIGDNKTFEVKVKARNMLSIKPATYGVDTNLNVYTRSGAIYPFYIRSESFNSVHVPDLLVKILGEETRSKINVAVNLASSSPSQASDVKNQQQDKDGSEKAKVIADISGRKITTNDFVEHAPADPAELHGWDDYKLWGNTEKFKPNLVARNKTATYLYYGDKWDQVELPTAYVVVNGIDEVVNTRIEGSTYVIEATADLISLKLGEDYMCIEYTGENG